MDGRCERAAARVGGVQKHYWDERLRLHWGAHGVGALAYGRHYNNWLYRVRRRAFNDVWRKLKVDVRQVRVLDVGSGTGFYIERWQELGAHGIVGLDFSPVAVERLRARFPAVAFHEADIGEPSVPLAAESFDVVGAFDVLFHIVDDARYAAALRNISTLLRRGGYLLYSDSFLRGETQQYLDYWKARSLHSVERVLRDVGLEVQVRVPVFVLMNSPVDAPWHVYRRLWNAAMTPVRRSEIAGFVTGALLYPLELALRQVVREGPSTEIIVCRKR